MSKQHRAFILLAQDLPSRQHIISLQYGRVSEFNDNWNDGRLWGPLDFSHTMSIHQWAHIRKFNIYFKTVIT